MITVFMLLVIFLSTQWLKIYTMHGKSMEVPDLQGKDLAEIETVLANSDMTYVVTDSIYANTRIPGAVVSQNPKAGMQVKRGRTVYVTVSRVLPEFTVVPDLMGKSKRIAIPILEISGLKLAALRYRPDETCTDCVVGLEYRGKEIEPNENIPKGHAVTLILGQQSNVPTTVPDLLGLTFAEAAELINAYSLNVGNVLACSGCQSARDSTFAFVVNHRPERNSDVNLGTFVDLYLTTDSTMAATLRVPADSTDSYEQN